MARNRHKVPQKQWRKWSPEAREMFNELYGDMRDAELFRHPKSAPIKGWEWKTTRWNAAWYAASLLDEIAGRGFTSTAHPGGR